MRARPTARRLAAPAAVLLVVLGLLIPFEPAYAAGPAMKQKTATATCSSPCSTGSLTVTSGNIVVGLLTDYSTLGLGSMAVTDTLGTTITSVVSHSRANCGGGQTVDSYIFDGTLGSSGSDALTATDVTINGVINMVMVEVSGATTSGQVTGTGDGTGSTIATGSTSFIFSAYVELASLFYDYCGTAPTVSAGTSYSLINAALVRGVFENSTSAASPTTFPYTIAGGSNYAWTETGIVLGSSGTTTTRSPSTAIALSANVMKSVILNAKTSVALQASVPKAETLGAQTRVALSASVTSLCSVTCHSVIANQRLLALLIILSIITGFVIVGVVVSRRR